MHNKVENLFAIVPVEIFDSALAEEADKKNLDVVKNQPLDAIITFSPVSERVSTLHNSTKLGGDILDKNDIYFSLFGHEDTAILAVHKPTFILTIAEITPPSWTSLNSAKTNKNKIADTPGRATILVASA